MTINFIIFINLLIILLFKEKYKNHILLIQIYKVEFTQLDYFVGINILVKVLMNIILNDLLIKVLE